MFDDDDDWFLDDEHDFYHLWHPRSADWDKDALLGENLHKHIDVHGNIKWMNDKGQLHRHDGPAVINKDGSVAYYENGLRHRTDGPAMVPVDPEYDSTWWFEGRLTTEGRVRLGVGPDAELPETFELMDKSHVLRSFNSSGELHCDDGPAVMDFDSGSWSWYRNGKKHREDGPAAMDNWGNLSFFLNGVQTTETRVAFEYGPNYANPAHEDISSELSCSEDGLTEWRTEDYRLHRTDGPAVYMENVREEWWLDGELHRTDGPAKQVFDELTEWWFYGLLHRVDGPAVTEVLHNGDVVEKWFFLGYWHRTDGPAEVVTHPDGSQDVKWIHWGVIHRDGNLPAIEYANGAKAWYVNGRHCRTDGPALIPAQGEPTYWLGEELPVPESRVLGYGADTFPDQWSTYDEDGCQVWLDSQGRLHRPDGPAMIFPNGKKEYYLMGEPKDEETVMGLFHIEEFLQLHAWLEVDDSLDDQ